LSWGRARATAYAPGDVIVVITENDKGLVADPAWREMLGSTAASMAKEMRKGRPLIKMDAYRGRRAECLCV